MRYGSHDGKKRVHDEEFYQLFKQAADLLYLKPHTILDEEGNKFKIVGCSDQKVHTTHKITLTMTITIKITITTQTTNTILL